MGGGLSPVGLYPDGVGPAGGLVAAVGHPAVELRCAFGSCLYRASHVLEDLGWVDLDLGSSLG